MPPPGYFMEPKKLRNRKTTKSKHKKGLLSLKKLNPILSEQYLEEILAICRAPIIPDNITTESIFQDDINKGCIGGEDRNFVSTSHLAPVAYSALVEATDNNNNENLDNMVKEEIKKSEGEIQNLSEYIPSSPFKSKEEEDEYLNSIFPC